MRMFLKTWIGGVSYFGCRRSQRGAREGLTLHFRCGGAANGSFPSRSSRLSTGCRGGCRETAEIHHSFRQKECLRPSEKMQIYQVVNLFTMCAAKDTLV